MVDVEAHHLAQRLGAVVVVVARVERRGLPLGAVDVLAPSRMENLIGEEANDWLRYVSDPAARLHLYGKAKARPGRKMGHVTFVTLR